MILSTACALNLEDCVARTESIFDQWIAKDLTTYVCVKSLYCSRASNLQLAYFIFLFPPRLPGHVKEIVYTAGVRRGKYENWMDLWKRFTEAELHAEKEEMMSALASTDEPLLINK